MGTRAADADSVLADELATQAAVAAAGGLHASRAHGRPLRYNQPNPWSPDLLVCRPEAAARMVTLITRHRQGILR